MHVASKSRSSGVHPQSHAIKGMTRAAVKVKQTCISQSPHDSECWLQVSCQPPMGNMTCVQLSDADAMRIRSMFCNPACLLQVSQQSPQGSVLYSPACLLHVSRQSPMRNMTSVPIAGGPGPNLYLCFRPPPCMLCLGKQLACCRFHNSHQ